MSQDEPVVTFVVPTRNSARTIAACLESIRAQRHPAVEIIVVDNLSTDGTAEIASPLADSVVVAGPERSAQRNEGGRASTGDVLVFIDSDMVLEPGIAGEAIELMRLPGFGAAVIPERSFGDGFWATCRILEKELYLGDASVEAARVFSRQAFEAAGGYDEALTGPEDYDLPDRVARLGWAVGRTVSTVWHDEGRVGLAAVFRKKRYYGRGLSRYLAQPTGRSRLRRTAFFAKRQALMRQPAQATGLMMLKFVDGLGLAVGIAEARLSDRLRASRVAPR